MHLVVNTFLEARSLREGWRFVAIAPQRDPLRGDRPAECACLYFKLDSQKTLTYAWYDSCLETIPAFVFPGFLTFSRLSFHGVVASLEFAQIPFTQDYFTQVQEQV
jgi:hypothetical protein